MEYSINSSLRLPSVNKSKTARSVFNKTKAQDILSPFELNSNNSYSRGSELFGPKKRRTNKFYYFKGDDDRMETPEPPKSQSVIRTRRYRSKPKEETTMLKPLRGKRRFNSPVVDVKQEQAILLPQPLYHNRKKSVDEQLLQQRVESPDLTSKPQVPVEEVRTRSKSVAKTFIGRSKYQQDFPDYGPMTVLKAPKDISLVKVQPNPNKVDYTTAYTRTYFEKQIERRKPIVPPGEKNPLFVPTEFHLKTTFQEDFPVHENVTPTETYKYSDFLDVEGEPIPDQFSTTQKKDFVEHNVELLPKTRCPCDSEMTMEHGGAQCTCGNHTCPTVSENSQLSLKSQFLSSYGANFKGKYASPEKPFKSPDQLIMNKEKMDLSTSMRENFQQPDEKYFAQAPSVAEEAESLSPIKLKFSGQSSYRGNFPYWEGLYKPILVKTKAAKYRKNPTPLDVNTTYTEGYKQKHVPKVVIRKKSAHKNIIRQTYEKEKNTTLFQDSFVLRRASSPSNKLVLPEDNLEVGGFARYETENRKHYKGEQIRESLSASQLATIDEDQN